MPDTSKPNSKPKSLLLALRPKTLPAAIVPVWAGSVLAWKLGHQFSWSLLIFTIGSALSIQISTNLFNDFLDARKGADTTERIGSTRATASGLLSSKIVVSWACAFLLIATLCALPLTGLRGWPILAIGIPSLFLSYGYTGGPFPLAYLGLGELFVLLFFGFIATLGTVFIQLGVWLIPESLLLGLAIGGFSCLLITLNNLRDISEDSKTGKNTLAVSFGWFKGRNLLVLEWMFTFVGGAGIAHSLGGGYLYFILLPSLTLLPVIGLAYFTTPAPIYNKFLAITGAHLLWFAIIFHCALNYACK